MMGCRGERVVIDEKHENQDSTTVYLDPLELQG